MTALKVDTLMPDFEIEGLIGDTYGASIALVKFAEQTFVGKHIRINQGGYHEIYLTDREIKALFYLLYAVQGHAHTLFEGFHAEPAPKAT